MPDSVGLSRALRAAPGWVALLAVLPYLPSLGGGFLNYDDPYLVVESRPIQEARLGHILDPRASRRELGAEYLPLRDLSYVLDAHLWGGVDAAGRSQLGPRAPFGFRLSNLLWYALACALATRFAQRLLDPAGGGGRRARVAVLGALLFALHPAHAESVAWVAGRKDLLSGAAVFAALLLHLRARRGGWAPLFASALVAGLACLSKSTATALPILILAVELLDPGGANEPWSRRLRRVLPATGVCGACALLAMSVGSRTGVGQALGPLELLSRLPEVLVRDLPVLRRYLVTACFPLRLRISHHGLIALAADWGRLGPQAVLALGGCLLPWFLLLLRSRSRALAFGTVWFLGGLLPVLNLIPFSQLIADRFLFLPLLAPCLGLAWLLVRAHAAAPRGAGLGIALCVLAGVGLSTARGLEFHSSRALWEANLRLEPRDPLSKRQLGEALLEEAREQPDARPLAARAARFLAEAVHDFQGLPRRGLRLEAHHVDAYRLLAEAHRLGDEQARARAVLQEACERFPGQPALWSALARVEAEAGRLRSALETLLPAAERLDAAGLSPDERAHWRGVLHHNLQVLAARLAASSSTSTDLGLAIRVLARVGNSAAARQVLTRLRASDSAAAARLAAELGL